MIDKVVVAELVKQINSLTEAAYEQEEKEHLKFYGWMKDFKPSAYLKDLRRRSNVAYNKLVRIAKKSNESEWDAMVAEIKIAPECYGYEALTEY